jgi:hypothetical protein
VRSARSTAMFLAGALAAGIWPYARNFWWTHDPVFPFLMGRFAPENMNRYTLASMLADTGQRDGRSFFEILKFPFFAAVDHAHAGFWQFFGPLCLVFAPLTLWRAFGRRREPLWRVIFCVWILGSIGIGLTSGMTRFLLPIFPIALAATFAGVATLDKVKWRFAIATSTLSITAYLLVCFAGLLVYEHSAFAAAIGKTAREVYLVQHAPDYGKAQFVNQVLAGKGGQERALVFFRHVYYLRVPFLYGDPTASWMIDPDRLNTPEAWLVFFRAHNVRWVVRAPQYPPAVATALEELERRGSLAPIAQGETNDLEGMRLLGAHQAMAIVILRVNK